MCELGPPARGILQPVTACAAILVQIGSSSDNGLRVGRAGEFQKGLPNESGFSVGFLYNRLIAPIQAGVLIRDWRLGTGVALGYDSLASSKGSGGAQRDTARLIG